MIDVAANSLGGSARFPKASVMVGVGLVAWMSTTAAQASSLVSADLGLRGAAMLLCMALLAGGFLAIVAAATLHHRRQGAQQSNFHRSVVAEVGWTLVPCLMVAVLVWPAARGALSL